MIQFTQNGPDLLLVYTPENSDGEWLNKQLNERGQAAISGRIFTVTKEMLYSDPEFSTEEFEPESFIFEIGIVSAGYYIIKKEVLGINYDLSIHVSIPLERKLFAAHRNISIFRRINEFGFKKLSVGGDDPDALPTEVFHKLLKEFPNSYEMDQYARARISSIIRGSLFISVDYDAKLHKYLNKKKSLIENQPLSIYSKYESEKYTDLLKKIENMLKQAEAYTEAQWQNEILQVILFLYPKYIKAFKEVPVRDSLASKYRQIDYLMVDASGYVDAIEIKKPFAECVVTSNRYRGNHVPMRELSGTVMQLEKYLYHLNRWGQQGEDTLNKKYGNKLPSDLKIKIVNPGGMIIMGRDEGLTPDQKSDFEVIRRKYRHVLEIMTYDDMFRRLKTIRDQFNLNIEP